MKKERIEMGAISRTGVMETGRDGIEDALWRMVSEDERSRDTEEDMYRGDFGSTQSLRRMAERKGKSEQVIRKNVERFHEEVSLSKYEISYQVVGQKGYVAQVLKVRLMLSVRGELRVDGRRFRNVTELKRHMKETSRPQQYEGMPIYSNFSVVGYIDTETRVYRTKPKALPKKYQWMDELVVVAYGAMNPI